MKKIVYTAPEMEIVELKSKFALLDASIVDNPGIHNEEPDPEQPITTED